ncbi:MAG: type II toxin-antitoxin system VapC family toxin [Actinomycetota bacterium]
MTAFVDSSAFYAVADVKDRAHARAKTLLAENQPLVTSDHVVVETWLLINSRLSFSAAEKFLSAVAAGPVGIEPVTLTDLEKAIGIAGIFKDQTFSVVDRTSFSIMERLGLGTAIAFDDDFLIYRFGPKRKSALEVLR